MKRNPPKLIVTVETASRVYSKFKCDEVQTTTDGNLALICYGQTRDQVLALFDSKSLRNVRANTAANPRMSQSQIVQ